MGPGEAFPKRARLTRKREFALVLARGQVFPGRECLVRRLANDGGRARLGISTPRRYGSSVARNRFRRLVREAFRRVQEALGPHDFLVSPRKGLEVPTLEGVREDLLRTRTASAAPPRGPGGRP
jgi:ribonuclease P protein component